MTRCIQSKRISKKITFFKRFAFQLLSPITKRYAPGLYAETVINESS